MSKKMLAEKLGLVVVGTMQLDNIGVVICKDKYDKVRVTIQDDNRMTYVGEFKENGLDSFKSALLMKLMNYGLDYNYSVAYRDMIVRRVVEVADTVVVEVI